MARKENYHADLVDVKLRFLKGNGEDIPDYLEYKGTTYAAFEMEAVYHE